MRKSVIKGQVELVSNMDTLDKSLRDILIRLNKAGYCTAGSCSGYEWEHIGKRKCCNFGPFVSIMAYNWEAKKIVLQFKQDLLGTYWNVGFNSYPYLQIWGDRQRVLSYSHNVYYDENHDLSHSVIFLSYRKDLSDEQIKRGWNILLSKLVGD